jgi:hypothetical protein
MKRFAWLSCGGAPLRTAVTARAAPPSPDITTEWADRFKHGLGRRRRRSSSRHDRTKTNAAADP